MFGIKTLVERRPGFNVSNIPQAWRNQKSLEIMCGEGSVCARPPRGRVTPVLGLTGTAISSGMNTRATGVERLSEDYLVSAHHQAGPCPKQTTLAFPNFEVSPLFQQYVTWPVGQFILPPKLVSLSSLKGHHIHSIGFC